MRTLRDILRGTESPEGGQHERRKRRKKERAIKAAKKKIRLDELRKARAAE